MATAIALAVVVPGLAIAGFVVADRINEDDPTAFDDVTIEQCSTDASGLPAAVLHATNDSADQSTYVIDVSFDAGSQRFDTVTVEIDRLPSGEMTEVVATSSTSAAGELRCSVTDVIRLSDEG